MVKFSGNVNIYPPSEKGEPWTATIGDKAYVEGKNMYECENPEQGKKAFCLEDSGIIIKFELKH